MNQWSIQSALDYLKAKRLQGNIYQVTFTGLKGCSAHDFLVNYHTYKVGNIQFILIKQQR